MSLDNFDLNYEELGNVKRKELKPLKTIQEVEVIGVYVSWAVLITAIILASVIGR